VCTSTLSAWPGRRCSPELSAHCLSATKTSYPPAWWLMTASMLILGKCASTQQDAVLVGEQVRQNAAARPRASGAPRRRCSKAKHQHPRSYEKRPAIKAGGRARQRAPSCRETGSSSSRGHHNRAQPQSSQPAVSGQNQQPQVVSPETSTTQSERSKRYKSNAAGGAKRLALSVRQ